MSAGRGLGVSGTTLPWAGGGGAAADERARGSGRAMLKKVLLVPGLAAAGCLIASPSAYATYFSYGVLYAKEGSTVVAEGKGNHGVDFPTNAWGGHIGSRDPRPGGSPAYGEIRFNWVKGGVVVNTSSMQSSRNLRSVWVDQPKYGALGTVIRQGQT